MPTLNKPTQRKREYNKARKDKVAKVYNKYKHIRDIYIQQYPLCQDCLNPNIINANGTSGECITPVAEVHHITPILEGKDEAEMMALGLNFYNLIGLCSFHHHLRHNKKG